MIFDDQNQPGVGPTVLPKLFRTLWVVSIPLHFLETFLTFLFKELFGFWNIIVTVRKEKKKKIEMCWLDLWYGQTDLKNNEISWADKFPALWNSKPQICTRQKHKHVKHYKYRGSRIQVTNIKCCEILTSVAIGTFSCFPLYTREQLQLMTNSTQ